MLRLNGADVLSVMVLLERVIASAIKKHLLPAYSGIMVTEQRC